MSQIQRRIAKLEADQDRADRPTLFVWQGQPLPPNTPPNAQVYVVSWQTQDPVEAISIT